MTTRPSNTNNNQGSNKAGNGNPHAGRQNSRPDNHISQSLQTGHNSAPISMQPSSRSAQMKDNAGPGQPLVAVIPASG